MKRHKFEVGMEVTIYDDSRVEAVTVIAGFDANGCPKTKVGRRGYPHESTWSKTGIGPKDERFGGRLRIRPTTEEDRQIIQRRFLVNLLGKVRWEHLSLELLTQIAALIPPKEAK